MPGKNRRRKQSATNNNEAGPQGETLKPSKKRSLCLIKAYFELESALFLTPRRQRRSFFQLAGGLLDATENCGWKVATKDKLLVKTGQDKSRKDKSMQQTVLSLYFSE
ncbi:MAG: hypothetical protein R3E36_09385 [Nitrosomonas sp.]|nr:hypothetical protein [Nitrosomonas sp.]